MVDEGLKLFIYVTNYYSFITNLVEIKEEVLSYTNFDLDSIVTPVNTDVLEGLLKESNYDPDKSNWLLNGFRKGFSIGYEGPKYVKIKSPNLKLEGIGSNLSLWNKVMKEVKLNRYAEPFEEIPFENYIQSPIGLVPKDGGKDTRLIFHLSYPRNKGTSVNANTPQHKCTVQYPDFNKAIEVCLRQGKNCHISKSDMKSTFRNLGIKRSNWKYLIMKAKSPIDNKIYYFVDKCLPFGASISCAHFQGFSDAVAHIVKFKTKEDLVNYLDDFLFAALLRWACNRQMQTFLNVCRDINFPVSLEKTYWATTSLVFLGFLIDTESQMVSIPKEKIIKGLKLIQNVLDKKSKKITVKELQKICGFLNFLGRCIVPGRAFTRRLYAHTSGSYNSNALKPHHHIRINSEMRLDLETWVKFLQHPSVFSRPFMDFTKLFTAQEIDMYSDATKNKDLGFGGYCSSSWMFGRWDPEFIEQKDPSIGYLELYAVVCVVVQWISRSANKRVVLFSDNMSVVYMINTTSSSCKNCMVLIRILVLHCLIHNVRVYAKHVTSKRNILADLLSKQKIQQFIELGNGKFEPTSTPVPEMLWPMSKLWLN